METMLQFMHNTALYKMARSDMFTILKSGETPEVKCKAMDILLRAGGPQSITVSHCNFTHGRNPLFAKKKKRP